MKKTLISSLALIAVSAFALDPDYSFREGVRSQVVSNLFAEGMVSNSALAVGAVTGPKVASGTISNIHLAADCITGLKIADGVVSNCHLVNRSVDASKLGAVSATNLSAATPILALDLGTGTNVTAANIRAGGTAGASAIVTNSGMLYTNVLTFVNGVLTTVAP